MPNLNPNGIEQYSNFLHLSIQIPINVLLCSVPIGEKSELEPYQPIGFNW